MGIVRGKARRRTRVRSTSTGRSAVVLLAALAVLPLLATPAGAQITLGVRGGATLSTMRLTPEAEWLEESSHKYGVHAALSLAYALNERLGIVAEAGYTQRGAELTILDYDALYDVIWGYDYVDLSVLGRASIGPAYLLAGPSMAFRVACYTKISTRSSCERVEAVYRENDFLLTGGAGVGFDLGSATLVAEGLYNLGLLDINNEEEHTAARHRGPVLRIGVDFRLW